MLAEADRLPAEGADGAEVARQLGVSEQTSKWTFVIHRTMEPWQLAERALSDGEMVGNKDN
jgi:hypothetical protein